MLSIHKPCESGLMEVRSGQTGPETAAPERPKCAARRARSLRTCHRPSLNERPLLKTPPDDGGYVPESAARIENDPNLTDGARRCARKIMEETYRRNREGRTFQVTVSYLARALGKCRRSVQRYLRLLEAGGYVGVDVAVGHRSRLCAGLVIRLLAPLFPRHHRERWPGTLRNPGATPKSQNQRFKILISRESWALRCMDGVFRALMKTNPLAGLPEVRAA
jgi:hypothetical protein